MSIKLKIVIVLLLALGVQSCRKQDYIQDTGKIVEFHSIFTSHFTQQLKNDVDLYIDYSTCMSEAVKNSNFFATLRPNVLGFNPVMYSIKGSEIKRQTQNQDTINQFLNTINEQEINYADLIVACEKIVNSDHQAILITDGEYITKPEGERLDLPYMLNNFKSWLTKGFEIYIYVEPYLEKNLHPKNRFYFIFTDSWKPENIVSQLKSKINFASFPSVKSFKISNTDFGVETEYTGIKQPKVNPNLGLNEDSYIKGYRYEFQEYGMDWKSIQEYIQNAPDSVTGEVMPGGDYLLRGIFLNSSGIEYYQIEDISVRVYNIYNEFRAFEDSLLSPEQLRAIPSFTELHEVFTIDRKIFQESGEVVVKFHPNFNGKNLNQSGDDPEKENLFKVDVVITNAQNVFLNKQSDFECFKWTSIKPGNNINSSVYESIKQLIQDPSISPEKVNSGVLYTIYIKTPSF